MHWKKCDIYTCHQWRPGRHPCEQKISLSRQLNVLRLQSVLNTI